MTVPLSNIRTFLNTISVLVHLFWAIYFSRKGRGPFPHHYAILPVYMTTIVALANFQEIYLRFSECALRRSYFVGLQLETLPLKGLHQSCFKACKFAKEEFYGGWFPMSSTKYFDKAFNSTTCDGLQWHIQNPVEHLRCSFFRKNHLNTPLDCFSTGDEI